MKNRNFFEGFKNATNGVIYVIKTERNIKIHLVVAVLVIILSIAYKITKLEFAIVCLTICSVISLELINTSVEIVADMIAQVRHPQIKLIKDIAAGAVLVSAIISVIVGYIIFFDRIKASIQAIIK